MRALKGYMQMGLVFYPCTMSAQVSKVHGLSDTGAFRAAQSGLSQSTSRALKPSPWQTYWGEDHGRSRAHTQAQLLSVAVPSPGEKHHSDAASREDCPNHDGSQDIHWWFSVFRMRVCAGQWLPTV